MRLVIFSLVGLALPALVQGCGCDGHGSPPKIQLTPPTRPLVWGDINIIHTTDSHGWLLGHQKTSFPEPNYSADLGDFTSFVSHMKEMADVSSYPLYAPEALVVSQDADISMLETWCGFAVGR
ncbi:hypothetical protein Ac2012v2_005191 [Leucoagaricus gongylophorus]